MTYVVVSGERRVDGQPLVLAARRLAKQGSGSVDTWGNAEAGRTGPRR